MTAARNDRNTVQFGPSRAEDSFRLERLEDEVKTEITNQIVNQIIESGSAIHRATTVTYDGIAQIGTATLEGGGAISFTNASRLATTTNDIILVTQTTNGSEWYMIGRITTAGSTAAPEFPNGVLDPSFPIDTDALVYDISGDVYYDQSRYGGRDTLYDYANSLGFGSDTILKVAGFGILGAGPEQSRLVGLCRSSNSNTELPDPPNVVLGSSTNWFTGGGKVFVWNTGGTQIDIYDFATGWDATGVTITALADSRVIGDANYGVYYIIGRVAATNTVKIYTFTTGTAVDRGALGLPTTTSAVENIAINNGYHVVRVQVTGTDYSYIRDISSPTNTFTQLTSAGGIAWITTAERRSYVDAAGDYVYQANASTGDVYEFSLTTGLPTIFYGVLPTLFLVRGITDGPAGGLLFLGFQNTDDLVNNYGATAPTWTTLSGSLSFTIWGWNGVTSTLVYYDHDLLNDTPLGSGDGAGRIGTTTSTATVEQDCSRAVRIDGNLRVFVGGHYRLSSGGTVTDKSSGWLLEFTNL